jgi:hypothetical protein
MVNKCEIKWIIGSLSSLLTLCTFLHLPCLEPKQPSKLHYMLCLPLAIRYLVHSSHLTRFLEIENFPNKIYSAHFHSLFHPLLTWIACFSCPLNTVFPNDCLN